jgi:hypothetical protein
LNTLCAVLLACLSYSSFSSHAAEQIRHIGTNETLSVQKYYYPSLLQIAIEKSTAKYGPAQRQIVDIPMEEQRQFVSLKNNVLDVMWTMTSIEREQDALPIRIPLLKGLIGYRVLVIRKNQQQEFAAFKHLEQLKQRTAVQGFGWADVEILQKNGFKVEVSSWHTSIFKSLDAGYYDYFPRSVLEAWSELEQYQFGGLMVDEHHLIVYPTAIYFFVNKNNSQLAERLEYGLKQAIADGSFEQHFKQYPQHMDALLKIESQQRQHHLISNPTLPEATPLQDKSLWFQFKS